MMGRCVNRRAELLCKLRYLGFRRAWRSRAGGSETVQYERREDAITYQAQVFDDGSGCRMSHCYNGTSICKPTRFGHSKHRLSPAQALAVQRRLVPKTRTHWEHYHG